MTDVVERRASKGRFNWMRGSKESSSKPKNAPPKLSKRDSTRRATSAVSGPRQMNKSQPAPSPTSAVPDQHVEEQIDIKALDTSELKDALESGLPVTTMLDAAGTELPKPEFAFEPPPAWAHKSGEWDAPQLPPQPRYQIHEPHGPAWYINHHLLPAQPASTSYPPTSNNSSLPQLNSSTSTASLPGTSRFLRSNSSGYRDDVDIMDATDPYGTQWHHTSPYDLGGATPRRRSAYVGPGVGTFSGPVEGSELLEQMSKSPSSSSLQSTNHNRLHPRSRASSYGRLAPSPLSQSMVPDDISKLSADPPSQPSTLSSAPQLTASSATTLPDTSSIFSKPSALLVDVPPSSTEDRTRSPSPQKRKPPPIDSTLVPESSQQGAEVEPETPKGLDAKERRKLSRRETLKRGGGSSIFGLFGGISTNTSSTSNPASPTSPTNAKAASVEDPSSSTPQSAPPSLKKEDASTTPTPPTTFPTRKRSVSATTYVAHRAESAKVERERSRRSSTVGRGTEPVAISGPVPLGAPKPPAQTRPLVPKTSSIAPPAPAARLTGEEKKEKRGSVFGRLVKKFSTVRKVSGDAASSPLVVAAAIEKGKGGESRLLKPPPANGRSGARTPPSPTAAKSPSDSKLNTSAPPTSLEALQDAAINEPLDLPPRLETPRFSHHELRPATPRSSSLSSSISDVLEQPTMALTVMNPDADSDVDVEVEVDRTTVHTTEPLPQMPTSAQFDPRLSTLSPPPRFSSALSPSEAHLSRASMEVRPPSTSELLYARPPSSAHEQPRSSSLKPESSSKRENDQQPSPSKSSSRNRERENNRDRERERDRDPDYRRSSPSKEESRRERDRDSRRDSRRVSSSRDDLPREEKRSSRATEERRESRYTRDSDREKEKERATLSPRASSSSPIKAEHVPSSSTPRPESRPPSGSTPASPPTRERRSNGDMSSSQREGRESRVEVPSSSQGGGKSKAPSSSGSSLAPPIASPHPTRRKQPSVETITALGKDWEVVAIPDESPRKEKSKSRDDIIHQSSAELSANAWTGPSAPGSPSVATRPRPVRIKPRRSLSIDSAVSSSRPPPTPPPKLQHARPPVSQPRRTSPSPAGQVSTPVVRSRTRVDSAARSNGHLSSSKPTNVRSPKLHPGTATPTSSSPATPRSESPAAKPSSSKPQRSQRAKHASLSTENLTANNNSKGSERDRLRKGQSWNEQPQDVPITPVPSSSRSKDKDSKASSTAGSANGLARAGSSHTSFSLQNPLGSRGAKPTAGSSSHTSPQPLSVPIQQYGYPHPGFWYAPYSYSHPTHYGQQSPYAYPAGMASSSRAHPVSVAYAASSSMPNMGALQSYPQQQRRPAAGTYVQFSSRAPYPVAPYPYPSPPHDASRTSSWGPYPQNRQSQQPQHQSHRQHHQ